MEMRRLTEIIINYINDNFLLSIELSEMPTDHTIVKTQSHI